MLTQTTNRAAVDGGVEALPSELASLAEELRLAGRALEASALQVVPRTERGAAICHRYQRAAASWPTAPPPSYEAFAGALARLHDAADAARQAARRCDGARRSVEALLRTP